MKVTTALSVKPIGSRRATLATEVRAEIERMIVAGDIPAGAKLNELALSDAMGVSRGTVREAIRSLIDTGLIDLVANRGAFVHEITLTDLRNLYDLRRALFALACGSAARRVGEGSEPDLPARLLDNLGLMQAAHARMDMEDYYALNIAFHAMLMVGSGNPKAKTIYDNLIREAHLFRRRGLSLATNIAKSIDEHAAICEAVAAGDETRARQAGEAHIAAGFARYMGLVEQEAARTDPAP